METFEKPEPCRSLGCVVEVVPAEGGGYWIQHATESKHVTALEDGVWVKFYDGAGTQLMQKEMALGERYVVPAGANGPLLRTGRPDALLTVVSEMIPPAMSAAE